MNNFLKILGLALVCLMLTACGKSNEEKVLAEAKAQNNASTTKQSMPDCARRDPKTRKYLNGKGCTDDAYKAWLNQQGL